MSKETYSNSSNTTRPSFIHNLKDSQNEAWDTFYSLYAPLIANFAKQRGCSPSQAEDVLQETVLAVLRTIPNFDTHRKKGKFRSLLYKITESKIIDAYRRTKRNVIVEDPEVIGKYQGVDLVDEKQSSLIWDKTWENFILSEATRITKEKVQPLTFKCFELTFIKGNKVKDAADLLEISPNLVAQHKHKVYTLIISEAEKLMEK